MIILGIDPGVATIGFGVIRGERQKNTLLRYGVITTPPGIPLSRRLLQISEDMEELIHTFHPDEMAVEELFFTKNITTGIAVAHGRGVILLAAETGYRIGEILGIDYTKDIDFKNHTIRIYFRDDNENGARAKNAEYRRAKVSNETFEFLMYYLAEYRKILQHQQFLFINIAGDDEGKALDVEAGKNIWTPECYQMSLQLDKLIETYMQCKEEVQL